MSKQVLWGVVAVVVIAFGLWWSGLISITPGTYQGAAAGSTADVETYDVTLRADLAGIDAQLAIVSRAVAALSSDPTRIEVSTAKKSIVTASKLMSNLLTKLDSRNANNKTANGPQLNSKVRTELLTHLSNATSAASAADKNSANAVNDVSVQTQAATQIKTAQNDLVAARANLQTLFAAFGIQ